MTVTDPTGRQAVTNYAYDMRNLLDTETRLNPQKIEEIHHYLHDFNGSQTKRMREEFAPNSSPPGRVGFTGENCEGDLAILEKREYNGFGELVSLYRDTDETKYRYRPDGLRLSSGSGTHFWDGREMIAEAGENGEIHSRYIRGIGLVAREQDERLQYYLFNHHGDVVERTDQQGTTLRRYAFDGFGNEVEPEPLDCNPFRYRGEYWEAKAGTYYLRARCYNPRTGRFTQVDPHWNPGNIAYGDSPVEMSHGVPMPNVHAVMQSGNLYVYCMNNPVRWVDSSGLFAGTKPTHSWTPQDFWAATMGAREASSAWWQAWDEDVQQRHIRMLQNIVEARGISRGDPTFDVFVLREKEARLRSFTEALFAISGGLRALAFLGDSSELVQALTERVTEPFVPTEYWTKNAPLYSTPGARFYHYKLHGGVVERSRVIYDRFGRLKYRIDFNNHGRADHSKPHLHEYTWFTGKTGKETFAIRRFDWWR